MTQRGILVLGALLAAAAVAVGAFGAHGLRNVIGTRELGWWTTAVHYHMWHALALVVLAALPIERRGLPAALFGSGILIFSGSLYLIALTGARWLGAVTPIGGLLLIAGWLLLAWRAFRSPGA